MCPRNEKSEQLAWGEQVWVHQTRTEKPDRQSKCCECGGLEMGRWLFPVSEVERLWRHLLEDVCWHDWHFMGVFQLLCWEWTRGVETEGSTSRFVIIQGRDDMCMCSVMSDSLWPHGLLPARLLCPWYFPGKNTGVDWHFDLKSDKSRRYWKELWCWRRLLRVPWTARRSNQLILKEIIPEYSLKWLMLKLQYLATWCEEPTHWKRYWCWEGLKVGGEWDGGGWDGWMASLTQRTWVWAGSSRWWRTGKSGV